MTGRSDPRLDWGISRRSLRSVYRVHTTVLARSSLARAAGPRKGAYY